MINHIDYHRLAAIMLPTRLRHPLLFALLRAAIAPLRSLHADFMAARESHNFRASHNGQVCRLRGALNDLYDERQRRITLGTVEREGDWLYAVSESGERIPVLDGHDGLTLTSEQIITAPQNDFAVFLPADIYNTCLDRVKQTVNDYKLPPKRALYFSFS